VINKTR